jgi:hypothetical protein
MKRNIIACAYEADLPTKTFKKPYLALEIEAFKNAMRFNYPEFVEIYDEYDIQSIKDGENIRDEHEQSELKAELKKILTK